MTLATTMTDIRNETLLSRIRASLRAGRARRAAYNRTHAELSALSNAELADIGISRGMINEIAREAGRMAV